MQPDAFVNDTAIEKSTTKDLIAINSNDFPHLQPKGEQTERDGLALDRATSDVSAESSVTDSGVSKYYEKITGFLTATQSNFTTSWSKELRCYANNVPCSCPRDRSCTCSMHIRVRLETVAELHRPLSQRKT